MDNLGAITRLCERSMGSFVRLLRYSVDPSMLFGKWPPVVASKADYSALFEVTLANKTNPKSRLCGLSLHFVFWNQFLD